ncbi:MAG: hypothetical protein ACREJU_05160 [Nitrospiraceae bacterium]
MLLAGLFASLLILALIVSDWFHFTSLTEPASRYGCQIARMENRLPRAPLALELQRFDRNGILRLPHGVARLFAPQSRIVLRPQYQLFSFRFRTAWPLKATIELESDGPSTHVKCLKRVPWSSAVLTLLWFALVGIGTVAFIIVFAANGGFASFSGVLMGLGITGIGLLVLAFGLVVVALAYRLEDARLTEAYRELLATLSGNSR